MTAVERALAAATAFEDPMLARDPLFLSQQLARMASFTASISPGATLVPIVVGTLTPEAERAANPAFQEIGPLVAQLTQTADYEKGLALRQKINQLLIRADAKNFKLKWEFSGDPANGNYLRELLRAPPAPALCRVSQQP